MRNEWLGRRPLIGLVLGLFLGLLAAVPVAAQPSAEAARELVKTVGEDVLDVLEDDSLSDREKFDRLVGLLEGPIDLDLVGRLILSRHWRAASEREQEEYLELFREYALANVSSKLHFYDGQGFEITGAKPLNEHDVMVTTRITGPEGASLNLDWRLRDRDGQLKAIDVIVEGVSLIVSQRSEFASVIERGGMDGLLSVLRKRIEEARARV